MNEIETTSLSKLDITVLYIAWAGIDIKTIQTFFESYQQYNSGYPHKLVIITRDYADKPEELKIIQDYANKFNAQIIDTPNIGQDFYAYYVGAKNTDSKYIICLNTHSKIMCDDWIKKVINTKQTYPQMEQIGYSGDWECCISLYNYYNNLLKQTTKTKNLKYHFNKNKYRLIDFFNIKDKQTSPNIFIRSNAFFINKQLYIDYFEKNLKNKFPTDKYQAYKIENGNNCISKYVQKCGYDFCVVGRDGKAYLKSEFPESGTYRTSKQNYIIEDKQIRIFNSSSPKIKNILQQNSWGKIEPEYLTVSIIYLARGIDWGIDAPKKFFESYEKFSAGFKHNVYIAAKGWETLPEQYKELQILAQKHNAQIIDLPDDGFDFAAHKRVAEQIDSDYILCLVTSCEIVCDNWLQKLMKPMPEHSLVGVCGSWSKNEGRFRYEKEKLKSKCKTKNLYYRLKSLAIRIYQISDFINCGKFPNYWIRSSTFLVNRKQYLDFYKKEKFCKTKFDAYVIEQHLSKKFKNKGLGICVVGRDGNIYEKENFDKSGTWYSEFKNYIITDKQIKIYENSDEKRKRLMENACWRNKYGNK